MMLGFGAITLRERESKVTNPPENYVLNICAVTLVCSDAKKEKQLRRVKVKVESEDMEGADASSIIAVLRPVTCENVSMALALGSHAQLRFSIECDGPEGCGNGVEVCGFFFLVACCFLRCASVAF